MAAAKTALVLSGGGSLGAVQVGMLQALSRADLAVDMIIGASVGALNGAFYAQNPTPEGADKLAELWCSLRKTDIFPLSLMAGLQALLFGRDHLVEAHSLSALIRRALVMQAIEEARIPLHIVATDVLSGAEVLLSSGNVEAALLASAAIPVVFPQVQIADRFLVDGGVSSNTPITSAVQLGAERIVVLPTGMTCAAQEPPRGLSALALHTLNLLSMRQLDRDVQHYASQVRISIVAPLCPLGVSVFDFSQTAALIRRAAAQTNEWLAGGGLEQSSAKPMPLAHHHHGHG